MNANDLFPPSKFLKSEDIEDSGGEMQLTVKGVSIKEYEEDDGGKTRKGLLGFVEIEKELALNATNTKTMCAMFGDKDIDKVWLGKTITLFVDPHVQYAGKEVKGIRIRLIDPKQDVITAFWTEARKRGFTQQDGRDHLKEFGGDFTKALDALLANPF
jgi:hypothetical protein